MVSFPPNLRIVFADIVTVAVSGNLSAPDVARVPPESVMSPENEFDPERVSVFEPVLLRPPVPCMETATVRSF